MLGRRGGKRTHAARTLDQEQARALRTLRAGSQPSRPLQELVHERWRFKSVRDTERASLHRARPVLGPHQQLSIVQERNRLQAIAVEFGDRFWIARSVNQD